MLSYAFADAVDIYYGVGIIVVPLLALAISLYFTRNMYRGGIQSGEQLVQELKGRSLYPIATDCPTCGSSDYEKAKDQENQIILIHDRICSKCRTRYTPPVPKPVCYIMFPLGVLLVVIGISLLRLANSTPELSVWLRLIGIAIPGWGVYYIFLGVAKLRQHRIR